MAPYRETRLGSFLGPIKKYDNVRRFSLLIARTQLYVGPLANLSLFDASSRWRDAPLSPEHRVYLSQIHRKESETGHASKLVPFCDAKISNSAPRWKMAVLTWIGVCFTVGVLGLLIGPWMTNWSWLSKLMAFNAVVVLLLTWLVMPVVTWFARGWLKS